MTFPSYPVIAGAVDLLPLEANFGIRQNKYFKTLHSSYEFMYLADHEIQASSKRQHFHLVSMFSSILSDLC